MLMAIVQMFWGALITGLNMWFTCKNGLRPWTGWADVHVDFSRVALFPTLVIPEFVLRWTYFLWWTIPISSALFFAFFSFGEDAMKEYAACIKWIRRVVFRQNILDSNKSSGYGSSFARYVCNYVVI
jgi:pheromone a factor receptor